MEVWIHHLGKVAVHTSVIAKKTMSNTFLWIYTFQNQPYFQEKLLWVQDSLELVYLELIFSTL